jgi:hypothetical protein
VATHAAPGGGKADDLHENGAHCPRFEAPLELTEIDSRASEVSGLVMSRRHPGWFWAHNDGEATEFALFAVHRDGRRGATLEVGGLDTLDLEDLSFGPGPDPDRDYLYLGDIGDNATKRDSVAVLRIPEPDPSPDDDMRVDFADMEAFELVYDDGDSYDAEALTVDPVSGEILVFTKAGDHKDESRVFRADLEDGVLVELADSDQLEALEGSIVAADTSLDGRWLGLLFKDGPAKLWRVEPGETLLEAIANSDACHAPSAPGQQEALAFSTLGPSFYLLPEGKSAALSAVHAHAPCPSLDATFRGPIDDPAVGDVAGLARSSTSSLWAIGGSSADLVELSRRGEVLRTLALPEADNIDWEDLAIGPGPDPLLEYLYVADIGDSDADRTTISVYRTAVPQPLQAPARTEELRFFYPDEPHDAEALLVDPATGALLIVTRQRDGDKTTRVYAAEPPFVDGSLVELEKVATEKHFDALKGTIVGADISPDGGMLVLARRDREPLLLHRNLDGPAWEALSSEGCPGLDLSGKHDAIALEGNQGSYLLLPDEEAPPLIEVRAQ